MTENGKNPEQILSESICEPGGNHQSCRKEIQRYETAYFRANGAHVHKRVYDDYDQIPNSEYHARITECIRNRQRTDEKSRHPRNEQKLAVRSNRWNTIGQPDIAPIHPKEQDEDHKGLQQTFPGQGLSQSRR